MKLKLHPSLKFEKQDVYISLRKEDYDGHEVVVHLSDIKYHISGYNLLYIRSNGLLCCNGVGSDNNFIDKIDIDISHRNILRIVGVDEL